MGAFPQPMCDPHQANGTQTHAAKLLDISRDALRYKLKKFGLIRGDGEEESAQPNSDENLVR